MTSRLFSPFASRFPRGFSLTAVAAAGCVSLFCSSHALAQSAGQIDTTFNPGVVVDPNDPTKTTGYRYQGPDSAPGTGGRTVALTNNGFTTYALALQPQYDADGNLTTYEAIIAGDLGTLFRVFLEETTITFTDPATGNATTATFEPGTIDPTFSGLTSDPLGFGADNARIIYALDVRNDGRIIIGGLFGRPPANPTSVKVIKGRRTATLNLGRLAPNGGTPSTLDTDPTTLKPVDTDPFNINVYRNGGTDGGVYALLRRTTGGGQVLVGGAFTTINKKKHPRLAQLNDDGTNDETFNQNLGTGFDGMVFSLAEDVDPDTGLANGRVYVAGTFTVLGKTRASKLIRLNADGTLDPSFSVSIDERALAVTVQRDGKVLVGGDFQTVNAQSRTNLARLLPDGSLDPDFLDAAGVMQSSPPGLPPTAVYAIRVQPDGRILVGGNFDMLNGEPHQYLGRLLANGVIDQTFFVDNTAFSDPAAVPRDAQQVANAVQQIVLVPDIATVSTPLQFPNLLIGTTRADRKAVSGDTGFFPGSTVRLLNDTPFALGDLFPAPAGVQ
ncbi:MAG: delta-60 repeat domain-containing protein [Verrucomicrobia bacterium]|nr:delta-60 repeat domain-containing protein [Verrucomicrobiota bacterium]